MASPDRTRKEGLFGSPLMSQGSYHRNSIEGEWNWKIDPDAGPDGKGDNYIDWKQWLGPAPKRDWSRDLGADRRLGLLRFRPSIADYAQLIRHALMAGLRVLFAYPALFGLFLPAIIDNLRDRFGRRQPVASGRIVSDRKDQLARVA